jgi:hypothetical protein
MLLLAVLSGRVKPRLRLLISPGNRMVGGALFGSSRKVFLGKRPWPSGDLYCIRRFPIRRERCLMAVSVEVCANLRALAIHEPSPCRRGSSLALATALGFSNSQLLNRDPLGAEVDRVRCVFLFRLTFIEESFELLGTQDVHEHAFEPERLPAEICRVLEPGGTHIATSPGCPVMATTRERATLADVGDVHREDAKCDRSPVNGDASLVTIACGSELFSRAADAEFDLEVRKSPQHRKRRVNGELREVLAFTKAAA